MSGKRKFYICSHCGNFVGLINDAGVPMMCCGEEMTELVPNSVDASLEKHVPVVSAAQSCADCIDVQIGSVPHPMEPAHHITFIYVETERGGQRKNLRVGEPPMLTFCFMGDKPLAVYAYCNLHGLWVKEI